MYLVRDCHSSFGHLELLALTIHHCYAIVSNVPRHQIIVNDKGLKLILDRSFYGMGKGGLSRITGEKIT